MIWIIVVSIFALGLVISAIIYFSSLFIGLIRARGVPFAPLSRKQLELVENYIKAEPSDKIVDLGCGDGRVLRMFEKQRVKDLTGYEVNFLAYLSAKIKNKFLKSNSKIYFKNFEKIDLSKYNIVFCYLLDSYVNLPSFKNKLEQELKPGTKVISYAFEIRNWHKPEIIYTNENNKKLGRLFIYRI